MPDIVITPASANIVFSSTANAGFIRLDTSTNTLIIQSSGGVQLGNTASDVYVGDGVNSIDIVYEQDGDIRALGGKTLNIGQGNSYVVLVGQTSMTGAFSGPIKSNVAVGTAVLELDGNAIIRKTTTGGALMIGRDDSVHIAAGESQTRIQQLFANSSEEVVLGAEGGIHLLTSSNNWGESAASNHVMSWTGRGVSIGGGLGLGTTAATATLDVRGNANVSTTLAAGNTTVSGFLKASNAIFTSASQIRLKTADTTSGYGVIHRHDGSDYYTLVTNNNDADGNWNSLRPFSFSLATGSVYLGGSNLTVLHGGNVGIGTSSPTQKLHVVGKALINDDIQLTGSNPRIDYNTNGASSLRFYDTTQALEMMRIQANTGYVGIGTTSPSDSLHVAGNMRIGGVGNYLYFDTTGGDKSAWIRTINDYVLSIFNNRGTRSEIRLGNELIQLFTGNDTERMRIDSVGRTMFNTTTANTTANTIMTVKALTSNTSNFAFEFRDSNDVLRSSITDRGAQNWYLQAGDGNEKGSIRYSTPGGFVGILYFDSAGVSRSDFRHVANGGFTWHAHSLGTVPPELMRLDNAGNLTIVGTLTESSSITLKENIDPIQDALGAITSLTGYVYDRKDGTAKRRAGLIAEEVETILPNVVKKDSDGNPTGIQYTNLIAYLVESIKELKAEIDILKGR